MRSPLNPSVPRGMRVRYTSRRRVTMGAVVTMPGAVQPKDQRWGGA